MNNVHTRKNVETMRAAPVSILLIGLLAAGLSGCMADLGLAPAPPLATAVVVGDEPYAVKAGAAILAVGGNAADAATAMYFALSVTYPVAAGLGGGGICIVHDARSGQDEEFDFPARDSAGGGPFAVPGNVRGFADLHTAYGALPWSRVVAASEEYAAAGFPISKALARRLNAAEKVVRLDAGLAAEFMDESGQVKAAGSVVSNRELAATLAAIRINGARAFYGGPLASRMAAYSAAEGGGLSVAELAAYPVRRGRPSSRRIGDLMLSFPSSGVGAGVFVGTLFDALGPLMSQTANTEAAVVSATKHTLANFGVANLPNDLGATGFAATDATGMAVACAVTMNGPFGSGHTAQGTGVTLASTPSKSEAGLSAAFLAPVIVSTADQKIVLVGAGAGGPVGTASMVDAVTRLSRGQAIATRGSPSLDLENTYDTLNAIHCEPDTGCTALLDAGANGMAAAPPG